MNYKYFNHTKILFFYFFLSVFLISISLGIENLNPKNLNWLLSDDRLGELIGWLNFKNSDWSFPPGNYKQGGYGNNSVVFNGTVPILAIIFKLLFKDLENFQYFGFWIFLCFFLQGILSYYILNHITQKKIFSIIGSIFFLLSPVFLHRIGIHISLGGHWILLAYFLNFVVKNNNYRNNNIFIIVLSSGIHFYFTAMLLVTDLIINFFKLFLRKQKINFFKDFFLKIFFLGVFMYLLGYFVLNPQDNLGGGFGIFKMNLISFFDPGVSTMGQKYLWSNFLPNLTTNYGEHEGFSYFGLGFIFLCLLAIIILSKNLNYLDKKNLKIYITVIIIFFSLSLSNNVGFFDLNIISIPLNELILAPLSLIRASGRFIWMINYFILIFSVLMIFKFFPKRNTQVIFCLLVIQVLDISIGFSGYSDKYFKNFKIQAEENSNSNWKKIEKNFDILTSSYLINPSPEIYSLSEFLVQSKLENELSVSARYDRERFSNLRYKNYELLLSGEFENKVFLVNNISHLNFLKNYYKNNDDIKYIKVKENWFIFNDSQNYFSNFPTLNSLDILSKKIELNKIYKINFKETLKKIDFLGLGWHSYKSMNEPWTDGKNSTLILDISKLDNFAGEYQLIINLENKFKKSDESFYLKVSTNDKSKKKFYKFEFNEKNEKEIKINFSNENFSDNVILILFEIEGKIKTDFENFVGINADKIGLKIKNLKVIKK